VTPTFWRLVRASVVLVLSLVYLSSVFQITDRTFWTSGLGDWMDPYFINGLLEHWFQSIGRLTDPSSPPMYFPAGKTLGYSHGLVLYAPAYVPLRLVFHPFQAYTLTLFAVMEIGTLCLYWLLRTRFRLGFIEAVLLSALFLTSANVVNGETGVWSQRASVFIVPPILLMLVMSRNPAGAAPTLIVAWLAGLCASLLFTQDFYTAIFALLFAALFLAAAILIEAAGTVRNGIAASWSAERGHGSRVALVATAVAAAWTGFVLISGGVAVRIGGVRIASHDWRRPALVALIGLAAFVGLRRGAWYKKLRSTTSPWMVSVALGAAVGLIVFLWIYVPAYREHPSFPDDNLWNALVSRDPAGWRRPLEFLTDLNPYATFRSFALVFAALILAWMPWLNVDRKARLYILWFGLVSVVVLLVPVKFGDFSVWRALLAPLPGFGVIRDPKRIIYLYELAVVLIVADVLARVPPRSAYRIGVVVVLAALLAANPNRDRFAYARPNEVYDRWVAAPIAIDRSCSSFVVKPASADYSSRLAHKWWLYGIDSLFVALNASIPTLNGYSAWHPTDWNLFNPEEEVYPARVARWIERHALTGVCELDVDARTMTPYRPER
jgi:hypothetical protein